MTDQAPIHVRTLTPTQLRVLQGVHRGLANKQIAFHLGIAEATVKAHMTALLRKLNVRNRTQVAILAEKSAATEPEGDWNAPALNRPADRARAPKRSAAGLRWARTPTTPPGRIKGPMAAGFFRARCDLSASTANTRPTPERRGRFASATGSTIRNGARLQTLADIRGFIWKQ